MLRETAPGQGVRGCAHRAARWRALPGRRAGEEDALVARMRARQYSIRYRWAHTGEGEDGEEGEVDMQDIWEVVQPQEARPTKNMRLLSQQQERQLQPSTAVKKPPQKG